MSVQDLGPIHSQHKIRKRKWKDAMMRQVCSENLPDLTQ